MMEIPFEGSLTKSEFLSVSKLARRPTTKNRMVFDLWAVLVTIGLVLVALGVWNIATVVRRASMRPDSVSALVLLIGGGVVLTIGVKARSIPGKQWDQNELYRMRRWGKITDRGIEVDTPLGQARFQWANLTGYGEYNGILVLFQETAMAVPFPQHFFANEDDWKAFRSIVARRLEITHQVTETGVSASQVPIYALILIAVISLLVRTCGR